MKKAKRLFLWTSGLDDFMAGRGAVGGLTVQMFFWGQVFAEHGWCVQSLTAHKEMRGREKQGITFVYLSHSRLLAPLLEVCKIFSVVCRRPDLILVRGATRSLGLLAFCCRLFRVKLVLMFASDNNLKPGAEWIVRPLEQKLFRWGLRHTRCFICQNQLQLDLLEKNYHLGKYAVIIPNIWLNPQTVQSQERGSILWIANFRDLKRPEMFLELARRFPEEHFVMAGGSMQRECYENARIQAQEIPNLDFLGAVSFEKSQQLFAEAKCFVCTSSVEGFPNTFLQAFSNGIPVLTTFDPSNIVKKYQLGMTGETEEDLQNALQSLRNDSAQYLQMRNRVQEYFAGHYSSERAFQILLQQAEISQKFRE